MFERLNKLTSNKFYWIFFIVFSTGMEAAALFYQYVLNYGPCILCIHVRIIVMGVFVISLAGLFMRQNKLAQILLNGVLLALSGFLIERSYMLLGIERGFLKGNCGVATGIPDWFAVDKWFPFMFQVWESCGYTPVLIFGITMAEALLFMSVILTVFCSLVVLAVLKNFTVNHK